jgi:hypothetical protein
MRPASICSRPGLLEQGEAHRHPGGALDQSHARVKGRLVALEGAVDDADARRHHRGRRRRRRRQRGGGERNRDWKRTAHAS